MFLPHKPGNVDKKNQQMHNKGIKIIKISEFVIKERKKKDKIKIPACLRFE